MRQSIYLLGTGLFGLGVVTCGSSAQAQEQPYFQQSVPAPSNAFELKVGTGYTQGFGNISPGRSIANVAGAGIGVSADVDYRATPMASIGIEGQYQEFVSENNASSRGLAANVGATIHAMPGVVGDPWLRLGTGYRMLWDVNPVGAPNTTNMFNGFDLVTGKVGYDFRVSPNVAFAPVVGADLQTFVWRDATPLSRAQVGTFIYAGLQGRFDAGGSSSDTSVARNF